VHQEQRRFLHRAPVRPQLLQDDFDTLTEMAESVTFVPND